MLIRFLALGYVVFLPALAEGAVMFTAVNPANGHTYHLLEPTTWTASEAEAVVLGGHLATINDAAENEWVFTTFNSGGPRSLWIGLTDQVTEGTFEWISGEPVFYTNFNPGFEPNNNPVEDPIHGEDYAHFFPGSRYWNDLADAGQAFAPLYGVVEVDSYSIPEPSAIAIWGIGLVGLVLSRRRRRVD